MISKIEQCEADENQSDYYLSEIERLDSELNNYYSDKLEIKPEFNRKLVSFQGNKDTTFFRWYKYKEAFSSKLVEYLALKYCKISSPESNSQIVLDPFAGVGTTLFSCSKLGFKTQGIELLPGEHPTFAVSKNT